MKQLTLNQGSKITAVTQPQADNLARNGFLSRFKKLFRNEAGSPFRHRDPFKSEAFESEESGKKKPPMYGVRKAFATGLVLVSLVNPFVSLGCSNTINITMPLTIINNPPMVDVSGVRPGYTNVGYVLEADDPEAKPITLDATAVPPIQSTSVPMTNSKGERVTKDQVNLIVADCTVTRTVPGSLK